MLFMVIERFKDRDPIPVYRRVRDAGIKFPEGLSYVGSWIEPNFDRCFQLMECDDPRLLQEWILNYKVQIYRIRQILELIWVTILQIKKIIT